MKLINKTIETPYSKLIILGDMHIGDKYCNYKLIEKTIKYIEENKDILVIINGDLINNCIIGSKSDPFSEEISPKEQIERAVKYLNPIKDRIICFTTGNHEFRTYKLTGIDPMETIAVKLGLEDIYTECHYVIKLKMPRINDSKGFITYTIFGTHGTRGGGRTKGSVANSLNDLSKICPNADLIIKSHTHQTMFYPENYIDVSGSTLVEKERHYVNANAFLNYGGYAEKYEYPVSNQVVNIIKIKQINSKNEFTGNSQRKFITDLERI